MRSTASAPQFDENRKVSHVGHVSDLKLPTPDKYQVKLVHLGTSPERDLTSKLASDASLELDLTNLKITPHPHGWQLFSRQPPYGNRQVSVSVSKYPVESELGRQFMQVTHQLASSDLYSDKVVAHGILAGTSLPYIIFKIPSGETLDLFLEEVVVSHRLSLGSHRFISQSFDWRSEDGLRVIQSLIRVGEQLVELQHSNIYPENILPSSIWLSSVSEDVSLLGIGVTAGCGESTRHNAVSCFGELLRSAMLGVAGENANAESLIGQSPELLAIVTRALQLKVCEPYSGLTDVLSDLSAFIARRPVSAFSQMFPTTSVIGKMYASESLVRQGCSVMKDFALRNRIGIAIIGGALTLASFGIYYSRRQMLSQTEAIVLATEKNELADRARERFHQFEEAVRDLDFKRAETIISKDLLFELTKYNDSNLSAIRDKLSINRASYATYNSIEKSLFDTYEKLGYSNLHDSPGPLLKMVPALKKSIKTFFNEGVPTQDEIQSLKAWFDESELSPEAKLRLGDYIVEALSIIEMLSHKDLYLKLTLPSPEVKGDRLKAINLIQEIVDHTSPNKDGIIHEGLQHLRDVINLDESQARETVTAPFPTISNRISSRMVMAFYRHFVNSSALTEKHPEWLQHPGAMSITSERFALSIDSRHVGANSLLLASCLQRLSDTNEGDPYVFAVIELGLQSVSRLIDYYPTNPQFRVIQARLRWNFHLEDRVFPGTTSLGKAIPVQLRSEVAAALKALGGESNLTSELLMIRGVSQLTYNSLHQSALSDLQRAHAIDPTNTEIQLYLTQAAFVCGHGFGEQGAVTEDEFLKILEVNSKSKYKYYPLCDVMLRASKRYPENRDTWRSKVTELTRSVSEVFPYIKTWALENFVSNGFFHEMEGYQDFYPLVAPDYVKSLRDGDRK